MLTRKSPHGSGEPLLAPPSPGSHSKSGKASTSSQNNNFNASTNFDFSDKNIRKQFICKVYSILMCQLLITLVLVAVAIYHEPTKHYINAHPWLGIIAIIVSVTTVIVLSCCENVRRQSPLNFILLLVFTLTMSFLIAVTVSHSYPEHVLLALGLTVLICFSLSIFAFQTTIDFTVMGGLLLVVLIVLSIASIIFIFFPGKLFELIFSSAGVILFSLYLLFDTQIMIGGGHKYSISPEEYIFAALAIYLDVINMFLYILAIKKWSSKV